MLLLLDLCITLTTCVESLLVSIVVALLNFVFCTPQAAAVHRERANRKSQRDRQLATVMMNLRMREQIIQALNLRCIYAYAHTHTNEHDCFFFLLLFKCCCCCYAGLAVDIAIFYYRRTSYLSTHHLNNCKHTSLTCYHNILILSLLYCFVCVPKA